MTDIKEIQHHVANLDNIYVEDNLYTGAEIEQLLAVAVAVRARYSATVKHATNVMEKNDKIIHSILVVCKKDITDKEYNYNFGDLSLTSTIIKARPKKYTKAYIMKNKLNKVTPTLLEIFRDDRATAELIAEKLKETSEYYNVLASLGIIDSMSGAPSVPTVRLKVTKND